MAKGAHETPEGERSTSERNTHRRHADPTYEGKHADKGGQQTDKK